MMSRTTENRKKEQKSHPPLSQIWLKCVERKDKKTHPPLSPISELHLVKMSGRKEQKTHPPVSPISKLHLVEMLCRKKEQKPYPPLSPISKLHLVEMLGTKVCLKCCSSKQTKLVHGEEDSTVIWQQAPIRSDQRLPTLSLLASHCLWPEQ